MNKDKVYLKGYVVGHSADTLGYKGLMVQLENLDVVEIDKNLVHKEIDEPQLIKLKDIIARIKGFDSGTRKVWLDGILNELGSDYGALKYKDGYKQGKLYGEWVGQQLKDVDKIRQDLKKPTVPQFVADWLNENDLREETLGEQSVFDVFDSLKNDSKNGYYENVKLWIDENGDLFARAWLDGYTVEKEKRYEVILCNGQSLKTVYRQGEDRLDFEKVYGDLERFTRKQLENACLGWVFDCPGVKVKEVE